MLGMPPPSPGLTHWSALTLSLRGQNCNGFPPRNLGGGGANGASQGSRGWGVERSRQGASGLPFNSPVPSFLSPTGQKGG